MDLQNLKERLIDAVETDNPSGTDYYGAELEEEDLEAARERMDESIQKAEPTSVAPVTHVEPS